ncbi:MAG TPA: HEAT repeat domain-containing protein [Dehalococcoidia bacterium]|nr:HEAT repeat domain-containing protein [Dehalococcoidia bacterium]
MPLEEFLEALADPATDTPVGEFVELSDLDPAELGVFARTWFGIDVEHQRWIISTMLELAEQNPEFDFSVIFKMCMKDPDEAVLEKAMEGLWESEDRSIIPGLIQVLQSDKSAHLRSLAAVALGKFSDLVQDGKLLLKDGEAIHDCLMAILVNEEEHIEVRRRSLEAIAPFNTEEIQRLVTLAYEDEDLLLKSSSIFAMGRTGEVSWLPVLIKELENPEPSIRYETANACAELAEEEVVPHLIALLEDDDDQVQLAGISALGKIGGPLAKKVLVHCVEEGDAVLEDAARAELENIEFLEDPLSFTSDI